MKGAALSGIFMAGFLALGALAALQAGWNGRVLEHFPARDLLNGKAAIAYEKNFDEKLFFADKAAREWGRADYALFREGKKGVVVEGDWLFTAEEFEFHPDATRRIAEKSAVIAQTRDRLKSRGIDLVVLPVPAKARLYAPDYPSYNYSIYEVFLGALKDWEVKTADPLPTMEAAKDGLYFKTDTHWTPKGARLAAQALAPFFQGDRRYETESGAEENLEGDLTRYAPGANFAERFESARTAPLENGDLFTDSSIPVTLVGTSYSADPRWNFAGFLQEALRADVYNAADPGLGPFETMRAYLDSAAYRDHPPRLIVWEIPERYVTAP